MYNYAEREKEREREREAHIIVHIAAQRRASEREERGRGRLQSVHMAEGAKFMPQYSPAPTYSSTQELRLHLLVDLDSHRHDV